MTLVSPGSVLHYWSALYGPMARIGGKPTHIRASAAKWIDEQGQVQNSIVNTPRDEYVDLGDGYGRRKVMRLEQARTNQILWSDDVSNAAWAKNNISVTTGIPDPSGGTSACTLTATVANATTDQTLSAGPSLVRTCSYWMRRRTGTGIVKLLTPDSLTYTIVTLTTNWQRFTLTGVASTAREGGVNILTSGDAIDVWRYQIEDGASRSSEIVTTSAAATRAMDDFHWAWNPDIQALYAYLRYVERGQAADATGARLMNLTLSSVASLIFYQSSGAIRGYHVAGGTPSYVQMPAVPVYGDTVEFAVALNAGGNAELGVMSINGAAVTSTPNTSGGAIGLSGSSTPGRTLSLSAVGDSPSNTDYAEIKIVKYGDVAAVTPQGIMNELRAFELDLRGAQL